VNWSNPSSAQQIKFN